MIESRKRPEQWSAILSEYLDSVNHVLGRFELLMLRIFFIVHVALALYRSR